VKRAGNIKDKQSKGNGKVQGIESLISEAYSSHYEPIKRSGEGKDFKGWISEASSTAKNAEVGREGPVGCRSRQSPGQTK